MFIEIKASRDKTGLTLTASAGVVSILLSAAVNELSAEAQTEGLAGALSAMLLQDVEAAQAVVKALSAPPALSALEASNAIAAKLGDPMQELEARQELEAKKEAEARELEAKEVARVERFFTATLEQFPAQDDVYHPEAPTPAPGVTTPAPDDAQEEPAYTPLHVPAQEEAAANLMAVSMWPDNGQVVKTKRGK